MDAAKAADAADNGTTLAVAGMSGQPTLKATASARAAATASRGATCRMCISGAEAPQRARHSCGTVGRERQLLRAGPDAVRGEDRACCGASFRFPRDRCGGGSGRAVHAFRVSLRPDA